MMISSYPQKNTFNPIKKTRFLLQNKNEDGDMCPTLCSPGDEDIISQSKTSSTYSKGTLNTIGMHTKSSARKEHNIPRRTTQLYRSPIRKLDTTETNVFFENKLYYDIKNNINPNVADIDTSFTSYISNLANTAPHRIFSARTSTQNNSSRVSLTKDNNRLFSYIPSDSSLTSELCTKSKQRAEGDNAKVKKSRYLSTVHKNCQVNTIHNTYGVPIYDLRQSFSKNIANYASNTHPFFNANRDIRKNTEIDITPSRTPFIPHSSTVQKNPRNHTVSNTTLPSIHATRTLQKSNTDCTNHALCGSFSNSKLYNATKKSTDSNTTKAKTSFVTCSTRMYEIPEDDIVFYTTSTTTHTIHNIV